MTHGDLPTHDIFLARQPILDPGQRQVGYELLFRCGDHDEARFSDGQAATATVISHSFSQIGLAAALGPFLAYINVDKDFLHDDAIQLMPPDRVVIEVLEGSAVTPEVVERCKELKAMGYTLALDDFSRITDDYAPLLPLASIIKVDITLVAPTDLPQLVAQLRPLGPKLLAEKVETPEDYARCKALGFDLFQGYYFARPTLITGRKLRSGQIVTLRLVSMLAQDAETSELERAFKEDPGLSVSMLRLVNSVGGRTQTRISSLKQAVIILGRQQLSRWLQLLLYANPDEEGVPPLLTLAALRGKLAELIADRVAGGDSRLRDSAYMVGILSLTPSLLGQSLETIVVPLNLARPISQALLEREGLLGHILTMIETLEGGTLADCLACLDHLPSLNLEQLNSCQTQAMAWANQIGMVSAE
jgi:EAL and modified HD-GYP domain-containing signal transduction protein